MHRREYAGLAQFGETTRGPWRFYLSTFSADGRTAHALAADDTLRAIPITEKGYITVGGRKFGPRQWDH